MVGDVTFSELLSNSASAHQQRTDQHIVQKLKILHAESIPDNMSEFPEDGGPTLLDYGKDARRQVLPFRLHLVRVHEHVTEATLGERQRAKCALGIFLGHY